MPPAMLLFYRKKIFSNLLKPLWWFMRTLLNIHVDALYTDENTVSFLTGLCAYITCPGLAGHMRLPDQVCLYIRLRRAVFFKRYVYLFVPPAMGVALPMPWRGCCINKESTIFVIFFYWIYFFSRLPKKPYVYLELLQTGLGLYHNRGHQHL